MDKIDKYLSSVYFNPKRPGGFGGVERLYRDVKEEGKYKLTLCTNPSDETLRGTVLW